MVGIINILVGAYHYYLDICVFWGLNLCNFIKMCFESEMSALKSKNVAFVGTYFRL